MIVCWFCVSAGKPPFYFESTKSNLSEIYMNLNTREQEAMLVIIKL